MTIKQNIDVAGTATTLGLQALKDAVAPQDGPPVERLREAGAIVIGRTNMPDVALRWHTDSSLAGATINPWDADASPGGSSGGEAVSLATGMSPLGVGTDLGGSVRIPAAACGRRVAEGHVGPRRRRVGRRAPAYTCDRTGGHHRTDGPPRRRPPRRVRPVPRERPRCALPRGGPPRARRANAVRGGRARRDASRCRGCDRARRGRAARRGAGRAATPPPPTSASRWRCGSR